MVIKPIKVLMEAPPAVTTTATEQRQTFIVVVNGCKPGSDKKVYEETVNKLLKTNGIHQEPISMSNNSCSFVINLLKEEQVRLSHSSSVSSVDIDYQLSIPPNP